MPKYYVKCGNHSLILNAESPRFAALDFLDKIKLPSASQSQTMEFGGLVGDTVYLNETGFESAAQMGYRFLDLVIDLSGES